MISSIQSISGVCALLLLLWYMRVKIRSLAGLHFSPYKPNKFRTQNTERMERVVDFSFVLSFIVGVQCSVCNHNMQIYFLCIEFEIQQNNRRI